MADGRTTDNDFIGFVFSFQDTHNFYVVYGSKQGSGQGPWKIVRVASTDLTKLESGMKEICITILMVLFICF